MLLTAVFYISSPADSQEYSAFEEDSVFWSTVTSRTDRKVLYQRLCWVRVSVPIFPPVTITCNNNNVGYYVVSLSWQLLKYFQWHTYIFSMANVYVVTIKYILCEKFLMNSTCSYLCYSLSLLLSVMTPHKQHVSRDHQTQGLLSSWANWRTSVCSHEVV